MKINEQTVYKGYLITCTVSGYTISKSGYHIAWAKDITEAKSSIDLIADLMG